MAEYWPELLTRASWEKLQVLKEEIGDFVLIGGWAIYLWTKMHKSKDIDIVVDFRALERMRQMYVLIKNQKLKKYEVKFDKFDIDIYVIHFSELTIPPEDLLEHFRAKVGGFDVPVPEALLVLKQGAEIQRRGSIKGEKDAIDICTLLLRTQFDVEEYLRILKEYGLDDYRDELINVIRYFDPLNSKTIGMSFKEFQAWRRRFIRGL